MILERMIQKVHPGCWEKLEELDKRYNEVEKKHGYPQKRRYQLYLGGSTTDTLVIERDWESMADWEKHFMEIMQDPEYAQLMKEHTGIIDSVQVEAYMRLP